MLNASFNLSNPFSSTFRSVVCWAKQLTRNKAVELQVMRTNVIVSASLRLTFKSDHAGLHLGFGLLGFECEAMLYDVRHWDTENNCWEKA